MRDDKAQARKDAMARRQLAKDLDRGFGAGVLSEVLAGHRGVPLSGYLPIGTEIDPRPAMAEATAHGTVGVPVILQRDTPLTFAQWVPDIALEDGPFRTKVPVEPIPMVPEIVIVPLLAFDRRGGRLGYGGGFYDRTLEGLRAQGPVLAIGFAFAGQEADHVPLEDTDQPLNLIVTDRGVIEVG